jgi:sugar phosphate permease
MGLTVEGRPEPESGAVSSELGAVKASEEETGYTLGQALSTAGFWLVFCSTFFVMFAASGFSLHAVSFLSDAGLSSRNATLVWSTSLGVSIGGRILFGFLSERYQKRYMASIANFARALSLTLLVLYALRMVPQAPALVQLVVLYGLGQGCNAVMSPLIIGETFGIRAFGKIMGLLGIPYTIGMALGQVAGGKLFVSQNDYNMAFILFAFAFFFAGVAIVLVRPYYLFEGRLSGE